MLDVVLFLAQTGHDVTYAHRNGAAGTPAELAGAVATKRLLAANGVGVIASDAKLAGVADARWLAAQNFDVAFLCLWYYREGAESIPAVMLPPLGGVEVQAELV